MAKLNIDVEHFLSLLNKCFVQGEIEDCVIIVKKTGLSVKSGAPAGSSKLFFEIHEEQNFVVKEEGHIAIKNIGKKIPLIKELVGLLTIEADDRQVIIKDKAGEKFVFQTEEASLIQSFVVVADKKLFDKKKMTLINEELKNAIEIPLDDLKKANKRASMFKWFVFKFTMAKIRKEEKLCIRTESEHKSQSSLLPLNISNFKGKLERCSGVVGSVLSSIISCMDGKKEENKIWIYFGKIGLIVTDEKTFWYCLGLAK